MAQYDFGTIDPNTKSGTALATDLNSYRNAVNSMHSGSSTPSYVTAGMLWVDTTSADYELKLYDGAQSITVAIIDATNNVARVAVDSAETSFITSTTAAQIRHVIASTNIFTTRSTGIQFNLASPVIADSNNNELISFTTTASAVNQINVANSATGVAVDLSAVGTDTNISISLTPKGTGGVIIPDISAADGVPSYRYVSTVAFTASGTFTKATYPWLNAVRVRVQAGGGGGRGPSSSANATAAGGGGAGGYSEEFILVGSLSASETVTVGAGGAGGAAGGNSGVSGNSSSFGSFCSATGGAGGANNGGAGGVGSGGDINASGGNGGHRMKAENDVAYSGHGGDSLLSGGGFGRFTAVAGGDGLLGSGGGAGFNNSAGGAGGTGIVIVELFA